VIGGPQSYAAVVAGSFFYGYPRLAIRAVCGIHRLIAHATHNSGHLARQMRKRMTTRRGM
jgi:hypothetical protein